MSSDADYASFLDKANEIPPSSGNESSQSMITKTVGADIPVSLLFIDKYYTSETDEPFEPVSLQWTGERLPSQDEFRNLIEHKADISTVSLKEWDPRGEYADVVEATKAAARASEVKVYRVSYGPTRAEYYIVSLDKENSRLVGLRAKAVES